MVKTKKEAGFKKVLDEEEKEAALQEAIEEELNKNPALREELKKEADEENDALNNELTTEDKILSTISSFGRDVDGSRFKLWHSQYVNKTDTGLQLEPEHQRGRVWDSTKKSRFIDSLTKGMPTPSLCIAVDRKTERRIVVDGLQRISTVIEFLDVANEFQLSGSREWRFPNPEQKSENKGKEDIRDIRKEFYGKTPADILEKHPRLFERVSAYSFPVNFIECDFNEPPHTILLQILFQRLNTGGVALTAQEVRNGVFGGNLNNLLKHLRRNEHVKELWPLPKNKDERFKWEELILRFFALAEDFDTKAKRLKNYEGRLTPFLDEYIKKHQNEEDGWIGKKRKLFLDTVQFFGKNLPQSTKINASRPKWVWDSLLIGIAKNLPKLERLSGDEKRQRIEKFLSWADKEIENKFGFGGTLGHERVRERVKKSVEFFEGTGT